jgi:hypothetical protein
MTQLGMGLRWGLGVLVAVGLTTALEERGVRSRAVAQKTLPARPPV